jgi:Rhodopirellula transposase DDE domain
VDAEKMVRQKFRRLKASMDERLTRLWAGAEAEAMGFGGIAAVARATGLAISTVTLGRNEVRAGAQTKGLVKVRRQGGGRHLHEVAHPELVPALERLVDPVTRGDPESPLRWTCKSTRALSAEMVSQ